MTKKNFWNDPEKGSIFLCLSDGGLGAALSLLSAAVCCLSALPRRPPPARVAAHKYIDARAISCDSRSGGKSAARTWRGVWNEREWRRHRCTSVGGGAAAGLLSLPLSLSLPVTLLKCLPAAAPHRAAARAHCFQLTLKKLQFLYFIGMSSFLVKATSVE